MSDLHIRGHIRGIGQGLAADLGRVLGAGWDDRPPGPAWRGPLAEFRHDALFDPGAGGVVEILQVAYRDPGAVVTRMERHRLCEQALVVTGAAGVVQVLARDRGGRPDPASAVALRLEAGQGVVMAQGVWHATLAPFGPAQALMLTRASTTADLAAHLCQGAPLRESDLATLEAPLRLSLSGPGA
jgi:ureidoglycolate lyase